MKVAKWGNSLAIRLPAVVVEALELREGDEIEIHVADARQLGVARKPAREELLKRLRAFRGSFFDRAIRLSERYCCEAAPRSGDSTHQSWSSLEIAGPTEKSLNETSKPSRCGEQHIMPISTVFEGGK